MLQLVKTERVYRPETVEAMAAAFDRVCASVPTLAGRIDARRQLAAIILQYVDRGETEPARLAELALREFSAPAPQAARAAAQQ